MATLPDGTIWLASYPKSGNTWMRLLLANLFYGGAVPVDINDIPGEEGIVTNRGFFEEQTAVDSTLLSLSEIERLRPAVHDGQIAERNKAVIVKVHDAYLRLADGTPLLGRTARAALYVVRDPRDVAVSYSFHMNLSLEASVRQMNDPNNTFRRPPLQIDHRLTDWSNHVAGWLDQRDVPVHLIRYEDLLADTAACFVRVLDFLSAQWSDAELARAVRHASFAQLQQLETQNGFRDRTARHAPFFRNGKTGDGLRHLSEALVRQIEQTNGAVMERLGYERTTAN